MKLKLLLKVQVFCLSFFVLIVKVNAQVTVLNGPSDNASNPPTSASLVNQVLASGSTISLKIGNSPATATDIIYQWYKLNNTGVKYLVQSSSNSTYVETATGAGYYTYQMVISNSNQCTSEISDPFKIYVLPALNPTIAASNSTVCSNGTSTATLTSNPGSSNYSYLYQWALNGTDITGATAATYTTTANAIGSNSYSVKVSYALSPANFGTTTQIINVIPVPTKPAITVGQ